MTCDLEVLRSVLDMEMPKGGRDRCAFNLFMRFPEKINRDSWFWHKLHCIRTRYPGEVRLKEHRAWYEDFWAERLNSNTNQ